MSAMQTPPDDPGDFGLEFNYMAWTAGTTVMLCNVPWNNDYRDIVAFASQNALDSYLVNNSGPKIDIQSMTYARPGMPVRINVPFNRAYKYNYLRVYNPAQPVHNSDEARVFYYFISNVRYIAPNTTELEIQLDVWQTFRWNVSFGNCYVERGHVGIANSQADDDFGRAYLTVPEGLDIGGEYTIANSYAHTIVDIHGSGYGVMVASTTSLTATPGTIENPHLATAQASDFERLPNGCGLYYFDSLAEYKTFMEWVSDYPWISQGIISITVVPNLNQGYFAAYTYNQETGDKLYYMYGERVADETITLKSNFRDAMGLPARYQHLTKFRTYPYSVIQLTTWSGNPLILKPESIANNDIKVLMKMHLAPPSPRIAIMPYGYNAGAWAGDSVINAEFLDVQTGIFDLPQFSTVNNSYISFMASNRNALHYGYTSADWSQQKALKGADTAFNQARGDVRTNQAVNELGTQRMNDQARLDTNLAAMRGAASVVNSTASGATGGAMAGPAGMAAGAAAGAAGAGLSAGMNYAIDSYAIREGTALNVNYARQSMGTQNLNSLFKADTNLAYAQYAAQGDYANAIAGIQAKVQDAKMMQPSVSGQIGGDAFNLATHKWEIAVKVKMLQGASLRAIGEFWLRYGYAVNTFMQMPASLMVMEKFTYWKLRETYLISSSCPEAFKMTIRGIFEKGVTVWANPADMGTIDIADNEPKTGVTY